VERLNWLEAKYTTCHIYNDVPLIWDQTHEPPGHSGNFFDTLVMRVI